MLAAVVLLAASGFGVFRIAKGAQSIEGTVDADPGTFVQHDIVFILDTFEDPAGGSAQYAVVPIGGQPPPLRLPPPPLHSYAEERDFIGFGISEPKQAVNKLWLRRRKDRSLITSRTEWL